MSVVNMEKCPLSALFNVKKINEKRKYTSFSTGQKNMNVICVCS